MTALDAGTDARLASAQPWVGLAAFRRRRRRVRRARWVVLNSALAGLCVGVVLVLARFAFQFYAVPSASMVPTLAVGGRIWVQKIWLGHLRAGDIVVFERPAADHVDTNIADVVKRIVAVPGDVVSSTGGHLVVDGQVVPEPYLRAGTLTTGVARQVVPAGDYFVMGDNRGDSYDSRFFGPIPASSIVGRVVAQVWPVSDLRVF